PALPRRALSASRQALRVSRPHAARGARQRRRASLALDAGGLHTGESVPPARLAGAARLSAARGAASGRRRAAGSGGEPPVDRPLPVPSPHAVPGIRAAV